MNSYQSYFNPNSIIKLLCKYRIKYANNRHKLHLLAESSSSRKILNDLDQKLQIPQELSKLLPSRRIWYKPNLEERNRFSDSQKLTEFALFKTISSIHWRIKNDDTFPKPQWYNLLNLFIANIQEHINNPLSRKINSPTIKPIKKENNKKCMECRPISIYALHERVVISLTAKYFTEFSDEYFVPNSFAFRAVQRINGNRIVPTHHDTISAIIDYLSLNNNKDIYVAECDIQKFFDCVSHIQVEASVERFESEYHIRFDRNALAILYQYLDSYSFSKVVFPLNESDYFLKHSMPGASFKWVNKELKKKYYDYFGVCPRLSNLTLGIPQGGALSCFISNLLLHYVDNLVVSTKEENLLYLRYCDDMILLHTERSKCSDALYRFESGIKKLKLLVHEPKEILEYNKKFWNTKSKSTYKWGPLNDHKANVPWLSFVGYQIKYDGSIRIRKKSITKQLLKQKEECDRLLKSLRAPNTTDPNQLSKKSKKQLLFSLENRLISMSVGRIRLFNAWKNHGLCWTAGFKKLNKNSTLEKQLKLLDRNRSQNLFKVKKEIKSITRPSRNVEMNEKKIFLGWPFSYHHFIYKKKFQPVSANSDTTSVKQNDL